MYKWKIGTVNFDMQVNSTLLGMMIVDTWLVFSKVTGTTELERFYPKISEELSDNKYDTMDIQAWRREETPVAIDRGLARAGLHAHHNSHLGLKTPWLCYTSKGKLHFLLHIATHHQFEG
jgi:hypothetical protein